MTTSVVAVFSKESYSARWCSIMMRVVHPIGNVSIDTFMFKSDAVEGLVAEYIREDNGELQTLIYVSSTDGEKVWCLLSDGRDVLMTPKEIERSPHGEGYRVIHAYLEKKKELGFITSIA